MTGISHETNGTSEERDAAQGVQSIQRGNRDLYSGHSVEVPVNAALLL